MLDRAEDDRRQNVRNGYVESGATLPVSLATYRRSTYEQAVTLYVFFKMLKDESSFKSSL